MKMLEAPTADAPSIYVVDDEPSLTDLYTSLLEATGYNVSPFHDRAEALAALEEDGDKPDLLITDYRGLSIPIGWFMLQCLAVHPTLRILMASGFEQRELQFCIVRPDRFIQKPFTGEAFLEEVKAALAA